MSIKNIDQMFGEKLRQFRKLKNLTQVELGDRIGIGHSSISLWEKGDRSPSIAHLYRICKILGCSADELLNINVQPFKEKGKNIEWITTFPPNTSINFTADIHAGIRLFQYIAMDGLGFSEIRQMDQEFANLNQRVLTNKINAAFLAKGIELTYVERDEIREEALKKKYNLQHCIVAKLDSLPEDGLVDIPIRSEAVAFLAARICIPLIRGLEDIGLTGGYPLARFFDLIPPYSPDLFGITWHSLLATQTHLSVAPMSGSANGIISQLLMRQPHTKGYTMPFINMERRGMKHYKSAEGDEKRELDYAHAAKRTAAYVQASFLSVGDPDTDYAMTETESVNPELMRLFDHLSGKDKDRCQGDILLRLLDEDGNRIGSIEDQQANEALVYSIELDDLRRLVKSKHQVWILSDNSKKARIIKPVLLSGLANCLSVENSIADILIN